MKKIGTANIIWKEFDNFVKTEKEHSMKKEPGWCSTAYRKRYKRMNVSFNVKKDGEEAVRYITVIYPVKKSADAPKFDAKFKNKTFDENGLEIEVKVNGKKQSLKYKL